MLSVLPQLLDYNFYAPTVLRFALGAIFLAHGWQKLSGDKTQLAGWLESINFKPGKFWAWLVALVEFLGGILLVIGLWTQFAALVLIIEFLVIVFWVQRGKPFVGGPASPAGGREFDFLILLTLLAILVLGPGAWSFDLPL